MSALDGFYSTWNKARETFGVGTPTDGSQYDGSSKLMAMKTTIESAAPDDRWQGSGSQAYAAANKEHAGVYGKLAELDKKMATEITNAANVVSNGRNKLDATKSWVDSAVASLPPTSAKDTESKLIPIARAGISQISTAVQNANKDMEAIGTRVTALKGQYEELTTQKFADGGDRRDGDPDARRGRRIQSDEMFGREEGGDRGGENLSTDWAGRAILERYLTGGDDWTIVDDPAWSKYMMDNKLLREQLLNPTQGVAQDALNQYLATGRTTSTFNQRLHGEIENGEGIVGYQYLHGTDSTVGDFNFNGTSNVHPLPDGTYEVTLDSGYQWNDKIDPNPTYSTDQSKSRFAEIITLGRADPYDMHITWHAQTTVKMDAEGNVISIKGYPAP